MEPKITSLQEARPIPGRTQDPSLLERPTHLNLGKRVDETVRPVMMYLGELLELIFLSTKDYKPQAGVHKYLYGIMYLIWEYSDCGDWRGEYNEVDEKIIDRFAEIINNNEYDTHNSWRKLLPGKSEYPWIHGTALELGVSDLLDYAYEGLPPFRDRFEEDVRREEYPKRFVDAINAVVAPLGPDNSVTRRLRKILLAAEGRLAIDEKLDVSPEQLAELAQIGIKSMRNALAPSGGSGLKMRGGTGAITAESALNWLRARGDYKPTCWEESEVTFKPASIAGEVLFVPFASDNIEFHPVACLRDGKYTVGPNGAEQIFTDYRAALDCLARMKPASYWKHPNAANNWRTVTAIGFRPRTPLELGLEPAQGGQE
jgi:hypothetical protein